MAGSERTEFRLALVALLAAVLGLVSQRLAPSAHLAPLALAAQAGLWALYGIVRLRRRLSRERPWRRLPRSHLP